ncbi:D-alanyl-D-alanine carboxypeptidase family protein [Microtetraspora sp. NBRC 16547]|uniref:D-alanyl-D-alanine carboxypeptidase family protein n=1 Tax=Microtetraspora sp. NBRC 16547 TaxID=3030993 RepID=UPI002552B8E0|nr:D-alanyl-D-alanine carboxypeptidase family protein [Microtetraspora sp. NBRC 16547]
MPSPRSAGLIAVVTAMTSLAGGATAGAAHAGSAPRSAAAAAVVPLKDPANLTELRREAQKAFKGIEDANRTLKARQKQFDAVQKQVATKLTQLQVANQQLAKVRKPLSEIVEFIYQDPTANSMAFFPNGDGTPTLRALSDVNHLVAGQNIVVSDAGKLFQERERLATEAQELRAENLLQEAQLDAEIDALRKRSSTLVKSLTRALVKLGVKVNANNRGTDACDPTRIDLAAQYPNGLLPKEYLCPLPQKGEELRADAAIAFADLNVAYKQRFGTPICVSDSYRSLADQQAVYYQRPGLAATPGKSNHGLGMAVDLCGGVQIFRSAQFNWLEANSKRFGFIHPDWAYHSPFEPWHWEYDPTVGSLL